MGLNAPLRIIQGSKPEEGKRLQIVRGETFVAVPLTKGLFYPEWKQVADEGRRWETAVSEIRVIPTEILIRMTRAGFQAVMEAEAGQYRIFNGFLAKRGKGQPVDTSPPDEAA